MFSAKSKKRAKLVASVAVLLLTIVGCRPEPDQVAFSIALQGVEHTRCHIEAGTGRQPNQMVCRGKYKGAARIWTGSIYPKMPNWVSLNTGTPSHRLDVEYITTRPGVVKVCSYKNGRSDDGRRCYTPGG